MLRQLREDARDYPATTVLSSLWVLIYLGMVANRLVNGWSRVPAWELFQELFLGSDGGYRFGDLTQNDLFAGEIWRAVTSTFVHYGVIHLGMNLYALYQLGCLVESWYGPGQFVAIYVATGGLGNVLSALARRALKHDPSITSAGGSVVVMGLVGLCAVVGWQSRTKLGNYLRNQMLLVIALTAGLGIGLSLFGLPIIDNWGHACGAFVGMLIGFANTPLTNAVGRKPALIAGWVASVTLVACAGAQVVDDRVEAKKRAAASVEARQKWLEDGKLLQQLEEVRQLYLVVATPRRIVRTARSIARPKPGVADPQQDLYASVVKALLTAFDSMAPALTKSPASSEFRRARDLLDTSRTDPPTASELREFDERTRLIEFTVAADRDLSRRKAEARYDGNR